VRAPCSTTAERITQIDRAQARTESLVRAALAQAGNAYPRTHGFGPHGAVQAGREAADNPQADGAALSAEIAEAPSRWADLSMKLMAQLMAAFQE